MKNSIGRIITLLSRNIQQELKNVVEPFGITVGEEPYFMELIYEEGITQEELTRRVNVDKAATARVVKSLEEKGLLIRKPDENDKRSKRLYLTDNAKQKYDPMSAKLQEYNKLLTRRLSEDEYQTVYKCLKKLYEDSLDREN